jgi:hypothetical protein
MAARRFRSKIDLWVLVLIVVVIIVQLVAITLAISEAGEAGAATGLILAMIGVVGLMVWLLAATHYTVDRGYIRIVSGPFRWKVPVAEITSVTATRNPLSSPALSLDRICIRYGGRRRIMISPADRAGFLEAIGHELEN